ncbi:VCBS repeat-containing protein [bacterium]|nr:VCBS repeat-containing protein [bacterium]
MPKLIVTRLEDRAVPAFFLPATYAAGEDTAGVINDLYDDPFGTRARTGDPTLASPYAVQFAADGSTRSTVGLGPAFAGGARVASADVTGDGIDDLVVATGPGTPNLLRVYDGAAQAVTFEVRPFESAFTGGVYVSVGDVTGDRVADLVVTPDQGGGPRVRVYRGGSTAGSFTVFADFLGIDDANFRGGARTAVGDVSGDGVGDIVVAAGFGGGPRVAVFAGGVLVFGPQRLFNDFFVFEPTLRNGVFVGAGDLDGDNRSDIFAAGGPGGGPRVLVLSGLGLVSNQVTVLADFFAGDPNTRGGVRVTVKDLDGDTFADLVTGAGPGAGSGRESLVQVFTGATLRATGSPTPIRAANAFPDSYFTDGVFVG